MRRIGQFAKRMKTERVPSGGAVSYFGPKGRYARRSATRKFRKGYARTGGYYGRFTGRGGEDKFFDTALAFNFDATGEVPATGQLVLIPQGVTESQRIGRKCTITRINMRGYVNYTPGADANMASSLFMYLVQDTQCNGAAAGVTDVLSSNNLATAYRNLSNSQRFKILKRFVFLINATAGVTTAYCKQVRIFNYSKKCRIPIEFSSTTGAIGEIKSNNLFLLAGTDSLSDDQAALVGTCRVRFSDN